MVRDLRFALRTIARRPAFAATVIGTLAIGIGASTAIFSFVNGVLLKPLPFPEADRLIAIEESNPAQGKPHYVASPRNVEDWQRASTTVAEFGIWRDWRFRLASADGPRGVAAAIAAPSLFRLLGVRPAAGRLLLDEENRPGRDHVVLASYRFWQRELGGRADAIGGTLPLDGEAWLLAGVLPPDFDTPELGDYDLWAPVSVDEDQTLGRHQHNRRVYARLAPGATVAGAQAELGSVAAALARQYPDTNAGWTVNVMPLIEYEVGDAARTTLLALAGAAVVVLLVACANVAHLLLLQVSSSERELAVRVALGAGRGALLRHVVTLGVVLAMLGGGAGALLAWPAVRALVALAPANVPRLSAVTVDARALAFTAVVAVAIGVLFSLLPALRSSRVDPAQSLRSGVRTSTGVENRRLRLVLVAAEVALTVVLLATAGLLARTVVSLSSLEPGFDPDRLLTTTVSMPYREGQGADRVRAFYQASLAAAAGIPGVEAVAGASAGPNFGGWEPIEVEVAGREAPRGEQHPTVRFFDVSAGYFSTMAIPVLRGRAIAATDDAASPPVAVVNATLAARFFPGEDPVGRRLVRVRGGGEIEIIGVVADTRQARVGAAPEAEIYWPYLQNPRWFTYLLVRSGAPAAALESAIRARIRELDPEAMVGRVTPMRSVIERQLRTPRFRLMLVAGFALVAVCLASVGVLSVVSYAAARRTHEIGVRVAVGAGRREIVRLVLLDGMRPVLIGTAVGIAGEYAAGRAIRSLLFGVLPLDVPTLAAMVTLMLLCGLAACAIPALRAASLDPVAALRYE